MVSGGCEAAGPRERDIRATLSTHVREREGQGGGKRGRASGQPTARNVMKRDQQPGTVRGYADLHEHLDLLRSEGLLLTIDRAIDKDSELHPLVRWQYVGGVEEGARKAFLFTNVVNAQGR